MKFLPVPIALLLSAAAGAATTGAAFPPRASLAPGDLRLTLIGDRYVDARADRTPEHGETMRPSGRGSRDPAPARQVGCHRDIRVDGAMLRSRHAGDNCAAREARRSNRP